MKTSPRDTNPSERTPVQGHRKPKVPVMTRIFVKVATDFDVVGMMTPRSITWSDGRVFPIDKVTDFRPASTLQRGRPGDCYTVLIRGAEKHLFFQKTDPLEGHRVGRWWVEVYHE